MLTRKQLKRIGIDALGYLLVIAAGLTGWIPGPGGIPLLVIGLSLLATNNSWADRILKSVQKKGLNVSQKLFSDNPSVRWGIDIASIILITLAVIILMQATRSLSKTTAIVLIIVAIFLLLGNRERIRTLRQKLFKH